MMDYLAATSGVAVSCSSAVHVFDGGSAERGEDRAMRYRASMVIVPLLILGSVVLPGKAMAQGPGIYAWRPGPYEIHYYWHRPRSFEHVPYFAEHPPVYYTPGPHLRPYGWAPYAYPGMQYRPGLARRPERMLRSTAVKAAPAATKQKPGRKPVKRAGRRRRRR